MGKSRQHRSAISALTMSTGHERHKKSDHIGNAEKALIAGNVDNALDEINLALALDPKKSAAHCMLGRVALALGQAQAALPAFQRAVSLDSCMTHRIWLALCLVEVKSFNNAREQLKIITKQLSDNLNDLILIGKTYEKLQDWHEAALMFQLALRLDQKDADLHHVCGRMLFELGRWDEAAKSHMKAIEINPNKASYYVDYSAALCAAGLFDAAYAAANSAVQIEATSARAYNNIGHALINLNRSAEAVIAYRQALVLEPENPKRRFGLACALLKNGDYEEGWHEYEARWSSVLTMRKDLNVPVWRGEHIAGKTILIYGEQGLGDILQFVRFVPLVARLHARIVLQVPNPLCRLLHGLEGVVDVVSDSVILPHVDLICPLCSLPFVLSITLTKLPTAPYIHLPTLKPSHSSTKSVDLGTLTVGLVWSGAARQKDQTDRSQFDSRRSISPELFRPLVDVEGARFISFQIGASRNQVSLVGENVEVGVDGVNDFLDTAIRLQKIDLLITVDTAIAHLAGGMGKTVWLLSRFDGCWRWLEDVTYSPWYPSMTIFRQPSAGDWKSVISGVKDSLTGEVMKHSLQSHQAR